MGGELQEYPNSLAVATSSPHPPTCLFTGPNFEFGPVRNSPRYIAPLHESLQPNEARCSTHTAFAFRGLPLLKAWCSIIVRFLLLPASEALCTNTVSLQESGSEVPNRLLSNTGFKFIVSTITAPSFQIFSPILPIIYSKSRLSRSPTLPDNEPETANMPLTISLQLHQRHTIWCTLLDNRLRFSRPSRMPTVYTRSPPLKSLLT